MSTRADDLALIEECFLDQLGWLLRDSKITQQEYEAEKARLIGTDIQKRRYIDVDKYRVAMLRSNARIEAIAEAILSQQTLMLSILRKSRQKQDHTTGNNLLLELYDRNYKIISESSTNEEEVDVAKVKQLKELSKFLQSKRETEFAPEQPAPDNPKRKKK